ncbi:MAG: hypothetical protein IKG70_05630 [Lachnospiraceae bacterium]|nr:hypothetical protein [Lachnospiraceae bacterium]
MKRLQKLTALLAAVAVCLTLSACSAGNPYTSAAGSFFIKTVRTFSEPAGRSMEEFFARLSDAPENGFWEAVAGELYDLYNPDEEETVPPQAKPQKTEGGSKPQNNGNNANSSPSEKETDSDEAPETDPEDPVSNELDSPYIPEYEHYDTDGFYDLCEKFEKAAQDGDPDQIEELYDQLVRELKRLATMDNLAFLHYAKNVNDEYYDEEKSYTELAYTDCADRFLTACRAALEAKGGSAFEKYADESLVEEARDYEPLTDKAKELLDRETALKSDYNRALDAINAITYEFNGKTYDFEMLYDDHSPLVMLSIFNYDDFLTVYEGLLKAANESIGPIYVELLQLRKELAAEYGYDNYADYCYENVYGRAYTTEDAEAFCDMIKENVGTEFYQSGASSFIYNSSYFNTGFSQEEMLDIIDGFTKGLDPEINDSFHELLSKNLYDIGDYDGRYAGSFTTTLYSEGLPFIFINDENTISGISTIEHEFGHFTNELYEEKDPDSFLRDGNYDVLEIHSNSMQLLCSNHYTEILDNEEALAAVEYEIALQLTSVMDGCIYDEFQRIAYEEDGLTLEDLNRLYGRLCREYGQMEIPGEEYMWILINHTFESPMYYISYAVSALSALEIWQISRTAGESKAVDIWLDLMHEQDDMDYEAVLEKVGLTPFTDTGAALKILTDAIDDLMEGDLISLPAETAA